MKNTFGGALLASVSVSALAIAGAAIAQDADDANATDSVEDQIIVTGSRLAPRDGYTAPTPVTVAATDSLNKIAPTDIADALNQLPQFQLSSSPSQSAHNFANPPTHGNLLNLRAVGPSKTLILFDGLRVAPTNYEGTVDINVLPNELFDRVEVVTGGASAAYGSDAVAGVVNFVLDRDFTGYKGTVQGGMSQRGDNENYRLSAAGGWDLFNDAGHLLLSVETNSNEGMLRSDREAASRNYIFAGSTPGGGTPGTAGNPFTIWENGTLQGSTEEGRLVATPTDFAFANYRFTETGQLVPFVGGTPTGTPGFFSGGDGFGISNDTHSVTPYRTYKTFGRFDYDVAPNMSMFAQGIFSRTEQEYIALANSFTSGTAAPVFFGNPFIPGELAAELNPGDSFQVAKYGANTLAKPVGQEENDFWMFTAGLEGEFGGGWAWDASYTHGDSEHTVDQGPLIRWREAYAALDAVDDGAGNIVCNASLSADPEIAARYADCVPFNIFLQGDAYGSQAGFDYITGTSSYVAKTEMDIFAANVRGEVFELPAGPISVAAGAEFRQQALSLTSNSDPALLDEQAEFDAYYDGLRGVSPSVLFFWLTNTGVAEGEVDVTEGYFEANVPLLADQPGFKSLDLNGAVRVTDYSTSGAVTTWKVGSTWQPIDQLLLRGTVSRDIRAPNLFELFAGDQSRIGFLADPVTQISNNVPQVAGGNVLLEPEEADTFTFGGVFSPSALPGFTLAVDYYNIEINGAINTLGMQQIVDNCFNSGGSAPECDLITRPSPDAFPTSVRLASSNSAFLKTSGIDFDATYARGVGPGDLNVRVFMTYLNEFQRQGYDGAPVEEYAGYAQPTSTPTAYPHWRGSIGVNYDVGNFGLYLTEQYIGSSDLGFERDGQQAQIYANPSIDAQWLTHLTGTYHVPEFDGGLELFATVNNLFDEDAPLVPSSIPGVNSPTIISVYDSVQRRYVMGARYRF